jgi:tetratricopeptide (TPR) repeat protein
MPQWERRHLALLRLRLLPTSNVEIAQAAQAFGEKARSFGARIEESSPTGFIAVFGLDPEDNAPSHAALAALAIQNAAAHERKNGANVDVVIGIHCGEHLVARQVSGVSIGVDGKAAAWSVLENLVASDTAGAILSSDAAVPFLTRRFRLERRPGEGPYAAAVLQQHDGPVTLTPFTARTSEYETVRQASVRAAERHGQIVGILGEPGMGKSRLVHEALALLTGWRVLTSGGTPYAKDTPYAPIAGLLKQYCDIRDVDTASSVRDKVTSSLPADAGDPAQLASPMLDLLGVLPAGDAFSRMDPAQRRQRTHEAIKQVFLALSQARPLCLVVEDLHWVDSETLALLDRLIESIPASPILIIVTYRPEYRHTWGSRTYYTQVRLDPLTSANVAELLAVLLGEDPTLALVKSALVGRTEGNPFFIEECSRSLLENGTLVGEKGHYRLGPGESFVLPQTVQVVIEARVHRLGREERALLQPASVIGKDVRVAVLEAISSMSSATFSDTLARLRRSEFMYETRAHPDPEYTFKHALTHEAVYASMTERDRRDYHQRVVKALEGLYRGRLTEHLELLAHHAVRGELWREAALYCQQAGQRQAARSAYTQAATTLEQALAALARLPEEQETMERGVDVRLDLRNILNAVGQVQRALGQLRDAEVLGRRLGDHDRLSHIVISMTHQLWLAGRTAEARRYGQMALTQAESSDNQSFKVRIYSILGMAEKFWGEYEKAEKHLTILLALLDQGPRSIATGTVEHGVIGRCNLAWIHCERGNFGAGIPIGEEALRLAESLQHPYSVGYASMHLAGEFVLQGEFRSAVNLCERGLAVSGMGALGFLSPWLGAILGYAQLFSGTVNEGVSRIQKAIDAHAAMGFGSWRSWLVSMLAEGLLLQGRYEESEKEAQGALLLAQECGEQRAEADIYRVLGDIEVHRMPPAPKAAEAHYNQGLALATKIGALPLVARCHLALGSLYGRMNNRGDGVVHIGRAADMFREMGMAYYLAKTHVEMDVLM